jgi:hypothetical protein
MTEPPAEAAPEAAPARLLAPAGQEGRRVSSVQARRLA